MADAVVRCGRGVVSELLAADALPPMASSAGCVARCWRCDFVGGDDEVDGLCDDAGSTVAVVTLVLTVVVFFTVVCCVALSGIVFFWDVAADDVCMAEESEVRLSLLVASICVVASPPLLEVRSCDSVGFLGLPRLLFAVAAATR